jgi:hypothetical protein
MKSIGHLFFYFFLLFAIESKSQSLVKKFLEVSRPEKIWVMKHPFIAKKSFHLTQQAQLITDSLQKNGILKDGNGGQLDAFRHAYWMALLAQHISPRKAMQLGKAHERGNYLDFKKNKTEDSLRADSMMCVMDLKNDSTGIAMGKDFSSPELTLVQGILNEVKDGKLVMIKKDAMGNYQDQSGRMINLKLYEHKWYIPKVLVKSNYTQAPVGTGG